MKRLFSILLALILLLSCAHAETVLYVQGGSADRVHLRADASYSAPSLGLYYTGTAAVQLGWLQNGWVRVKIGAEEGYIAQEYLSDADYVASAAPVYTVHNPYSTWVNLRSMPTTDSTAMAQYDNGARVEVLGETADGWSYVRTDFLMGYMKTEMLSPGNKYGNHVSLTVETPAQTAVVGQSREGDYIHRYQADNGQDIYFTSMEEFPHIEKQDVNFDGRADLVVSTAMGASNFFCQLFIFDGRWYTPVTQHDQAVELCNFQLYPEKNMVLSSANNGNAGALFEKELYRWNGTQLELVRRAVSEERTMTEFVSGDKFVTTVELDAYHAQVRDFTSGEYEGSIIWEIESVRSLVDAAWLENVTDALWMGL